MKNILKVSELFNSIQGEGRYQGIPALFIRLSGCTRRCFFCDSKYHEKGKNIKYSQLYGMMYKNIAPTIVVTGGEPLLQWKQLKKFLGKYFPYMKTRIHLETNGDLIKNEKYLEELLEYFNYIVVSPKSEKTAKKVATILREYLGRNSCYGKFVDIKVVTDLKTVNMEMLRFCTMLMPLTTYSRKKDQKIRKDVWQYCIDHNLFYSARLHVDIFGKKRAV